MKTQLVKLYVIFSLLLMPLLTNAQEYKMAMSSGTLKFNEVNNLSIEGYDGNEVVFTYTGEAEMPDRAKGLHPINSLGMEDNTGMGLSVVKTDTAVEVQQVIKQNHDGRYKVQVPAGVKIKVTYTGVGGQDINISGMQSDVEVSVQYNSVNLENNSGPALINTIYGTVTASFAAIKQNQPISVISVYNDVDVALPADTKASLTLASQHGNIYTDMDVAYAKAANAMKEISPVIKGKLNDGGTDIYLESKYKNVYLRKK